MKVLERKMIWIERILRFSSNKREKFVILTAKTKCQRGKSVLVISNDILQVFESIFQVEEIVMSVLFDYGFVLCLQPIIQISSVFITICFFQNDLCFILEGEGECLMILTSIIDLWSSSSSSPTIRFLAEIVERIIQALDVLQQLPLVCENELAIQGYQQTILRVRDQVLIFRENFEV